MLQPPVARTQDEEIEQLGRQRVDPYRWMKDPNWQAALTDPDVLDPAIRDHLVAERDYAAEMLTHLTGDLTAELHEELKARLEPEASSVPAPDGPWAYYRRYREGGEYPIIARIPRHGGDEQVILDGDARSAGSGFYSLGGVIHSPDHRRVAILEDRVGSEEDRMAILDLETGEETPDVLTRVSSLAWADPDTVYATLLDEHHRPLRVIRLHLPTGERSDVYTEPDEGFFVGVHRSASGRFVLISTGNHDTSEMHAIDLTDPDAAPVCLAPRVRGVEYRADHHDGRWVIRTNLEAEDFRIVTAPIASTSSDDWDDLVASQPGTLVAAHVSLSHHLVRLETRDALPRIVVHEWATGDERTLDFDEAAFSLGLQPGYEQDTTVLRFTYSSPATPARTYDEDLATGERVLRKEQVVPSGHDPDDYLVERRFAVAPDGEEVPITVLRRRDDLGAPTPLLLYGYGAYGSSMPASFNPHVFSLVDRGVAWAVAHVRGGMEKGYGWYTAGSRLERPNTHSDFIAVAEHLIEAGITTAGWIACHGRSAGGLLVGAVANLRPDLWGAVLADVPFVDVLNTMSDATLPLTPIEWPLWGDPLTDPDAYDVIAGYSPYDNVVAADYPPMYVTAGVSDPRVTYWEAAKWVARLRATKTDTNPILFRVNVDAGHFGSAGRYEYLEEEAARDAFTLWALGKLGAPETLEEPS